MSSACTPRRLVGRRVRRKFASCFSVRRIRLEEKSKAYSRKSPMTTNGGSECRRISPQIQISPSHRNRISGGEAEPHIANEEYLVFYFRKDGAIEIANDASSGHHDDDDNQNRATAAAEKSRRYDEVEEMKKIEEAKLSLGEMEQQLESCDSHRSDTSSASFAFPILRIEEWRQPNSHTQEWESKCSPTLF